MPAGHLSIINFGASTIRVFGKWSFVWDTWVNGSFDSVGNGSAFDLDIVYSFDGPELQGTGGAIRQALPLLGSAFFVLYGDSYLECNFATVQQAYEAAGRLVLMTVFHNQGQWDQSNVEFRDSRLLAYDKVHRTDKMHYIDYGLGIFHRRAFDIELE